MHKETLANAETLSNAVVLWYWISEDELLNEDVSSEELSKEDVSKEELSKEELSKEELRKAVWWTLTIPPEMGWPGW